MKFPHATPLLMILVASVFAAGCRAHPASLAVALVGDAVDDADVKKRFGDLEGKTPEAADEMFGERIATLIDTSRENRKALIYPVKADLHDKSRFVVEVVGNRIVSLSKKTHDKDGVEDVIKKADLKKKLIGKDAAACSEEGKLDKLMLVLREEDTGRLWRVYDVANWTHFGAARYCVLKFDEDDLCSEINLVGLAASTVKGGAFKGE